MVWEGVSGVKHVFLHLSELNMCLRACI